MNLIKPIYFWYKYSKENIPFFIMESTMDTNKNSFWKTTKFAVWVYLGGLLLTLISGEVYLYHHKTPPTASSEEAAASPPAPAPAASAGPEKFPALEADQEDPDYWVAVGNGPKNSDIPNRTVNLKGVPFTMPSLQPLVLEMQENPNEAPWVYVEFGWCDQPLMIDGFRLANCHFSAGKGDSIPVVSATPEIRAKLLFQSKMDWEMGIIHEGPKRHLAVKGRLRISNGDFVLMVE